MELASVGPDTVIRRADSAVWSALGENVVTMNIEHGTYFGLESVASRIWSLIEEPVSLATICDRLVQEYDVSPGRCQEDVVKFVGDMLQHHIVCTDRCIDE